MLFSYDAAQQLTSITPPGKPAHTFTHTPWGQLASRTSAGVAVTTFSYDADQRLTEIAYPGGVTIGFAYDASRAAGQAHDGRGRHRFQLQSRDGKTRDYHSAERRQCRPEL